MFISVLSYLPVTCEIQHQRQEVYCAYSDHTRLFQFRGSKPQFLTAVQSLELFRSTQGFRVDGLPALQRWEYVLETLSSKLAEGNLERHTCEGTISSHSHSDNCVFFSNQLYLFADNAAVIQMNHKGRSPNQRHVTRTQRVDLHWLFERVNLDHSILKKSCEQQIYWRTF